MPLTHCVGHGLPVALLSPSPTILAQTTMTSPGATRDYPDAINNPSNSEMNLYSASERVLGTPELLRTVLDLFDAGSVSEEESEGDVLGRKAKRADLASCARVSRRFSEHALDVLWRTLDSTLPLLRTLPSFRLIGKTWVRLLCALGGRC